jgi:hypothetical protein
VLAGDCLPARAGGPPHAPPRRAVALRRALARGADRCTSKHQLRTGTDKGNPTV